MKRSDSILQNYYMSRLPKYQERPGTITLKTSDGETFNLGTKDPLYHWLYDNYPARAIQERRIGNRGSDGVWNLNISSQDIPAEFREPYYSKVVTAPEVVVTGKYTPTAAKARRDAAAQVGEFEDFQAKEKASYPSWYRRSSLYNPQKDFQDETAAYNNLLNIRFYQNVIDQVPQREGESRLDYITRINQAAGSDQFVNRARSYNVSQPFAPAEFDLLKQWGKKALVYGTALPYFPTMSALNAAGQGNYWDVIEQTANQPVSGLTKEEAEGVGIFQPFESFDRATFNYVLGPALRFGDDLVSPSGKQRRQFSTRYMGPSQGDLAFTSIVNPLNYFGPSLLSTGARTGVNIARHPLVQALPKVVKYGQVKPYLEAATLAGLNRLSPMLANNPLTRGIYKNAAFKVGSLGVDEFRTFPQIIKALTSRKPGSYRGLAPTNKEWEAANNITLNEYLNNRNLLRNYIYGDTQGFEVSDLPTSGLEKYYRRYGDLKKYKMDNSVLQDNDYPLESLMSQITGNSKISPYADRLSGIGNFEEKVAELKRIIKEEGPGSFGSESNVSLGYDDIAGHQKFLSLDPEGRLNVTTQDIWKFTPEDYNFKWGMGDLDFFKGRLNNIDNSKSLKQWLNDYMKSKQASLMDRAGKPFILLDKRPVASFRESVGQPLPKEFSELKMKIEDYTPAELEELGLAPKVNLSDIINEHSRGILAGTGSVKNITSKDLVNSINKLLAKGLGIKKQDLPLSVSLINDEEGFLNLNTHIGDELAGSIKLRQNKIRPKTFMENILGRKINTPIKQFDNTIGYSKYWDYPFRNMKRNFDDIVTETGEWIPKQYYNSGISGEFNAAINETLKSKGLGNLLSTRSGSQTILGKQRWDKLVEKGLAERIGDIYYKMKKDGGPIVNQRGFMDGIPPQGSNWRIMGDGRGTSITMDLPDMPDEILVVPDGEFENAEIMKKGEDKYFMGADFVDEYLLKDGGLTPNKAREILHDKEVHGRPLTEKQRRYFGAMSKGHTNKYQLGGKTDDEKRALAKRTVEIARRRAEQGQWVSVPQSIQDAAEKLGESSNSCIGGVCDVLKEANVIPNVIWSNTEFARLAPSLGFNAANRGWGLKGIENLEPGDIVQWMDPNEKNPNKAVPHHGQIYLGTNIKGELEFFDNFSETIKSYPRERIEEQLSWTRKPAESQMQIYKINPYNPKPGNVNPEAQKALEEREANLKYQTGYQGALPEYEYSLRPDSPYINNPPIGMIKFLEKANDPGFIDDLVKSIDKAGYAKRATREQIHDSLLNVFGILGEENKWDNPWVGGDITGGSSPIPIPLESTVERIASPSTMSIGPGQIKFSQINKAIKKAFGINRRQDLQKWDKVIPLMVGLDIANKQWMENQGERFSERIIGQPGLRSTEFKWDEGRISPYFFRGPGIKNIRKYVESLYGKDWYDKFKPQYMQDVEDMEEDPVKREQFVKDNIRKYQLVFDPGSYGQRVFENINKNLQRKILRKGEIDIEAEPMDAISLQEVILNSKRTPRRQLGGNALGMLRDYGGGISVPPKYQERPGTIGGREFVQQWMQSPMYNQMLAASAQGPEFERINAGRIGNLSIPTNVSTDIHLHGTNTLGQKQHRIRTMFNATVPEREEMIRVLQAAVDNPKDKEAKRRAEEIMKPVITGWDIKMNPMLKPGTLDYEATLAHEYGHTTDDRFISKFPHQLSRKELMSQSQDASPYIPKSDIEKMQSYYQGKVNNDLAKYVSSPQETRQYLTSLRYLGKTQGVYDPFTEKITPEQYRRIKPTELNDPAGILRNIYTDEQIIDMLNSISMRRNQGLPLGQDGKEITYTWDPSGSSGDQYMLKRTVTPYRRKRDIRRFTQAPTDPSQVNFISNYAAAIEDPSSEGFNYPTSVPFEGAKHWNIDRFIIEPAFSNVSEDLQNRQSTKREMKQNVLADMYKYFMVQNQGDKKDAWKQAKQFVRKEINPRIGGSFYNAYLRGNDMPLPGLGMGITDAIRPEYMYNVNRMIEDAGTELADYAARRYAENPVPKSKYKKFGMDWLMNYKGLSRKEAKDYLKESENDPFLNYKSGGQHGGLDRWFAEKWVDVKTGKPCGRQEGESRAYPACRPSKRVSSKTPKTSSELSSAEREKFKRSKTSSERIPYSHKRRK